MNQINEWYTGIGIVYPDISSIKFNKYDVRYQTKKNSWAYSELIQLCLFVKSATPIIKKKNGTHDFKHSLLYQLNQFGRNKV